MAYIEVISLAEGKKFLKLLPPNLTTPTDEDALVSSLCAAVADEIRYNMTNRAEDADFTAIVSNAKVQHVAKEMLQWYFAQSKHGGDRQGLVSLADTMNGASATTSYETSETVDKRWRRELRPFRIFPL
jgi:hypothetical protein